MLHLIFVILLMVPFISCFIIGMEEGDTIPLQLIQSVDTSPKYSVKKVISSTKEKCQRCLPNLYEHQSLKSRKAICGCGASIVTYTAPLKCAQWLYGRCVADPCSDSCMDTWFPRGCSDTNEVVCNGSSWILTLSIFAGSAVSVCAWNPCCKVCNSCEVTEVEYSGGGLHRPIPVIH